MDFPPTESPGGFTRPSAKMDKKRLDLLVMEKRGFSRLYAREVIEAGLVLVKGKAALRPGRMVFDHEADEIKILAHDMPYVSRGGYKLARALEAFDIYLSGLECLDAGASTGGFTDCMLKAGARLVWAVDVGREQMAPALKADPRVILHEGVDIRDFTLPKPVDFAACDVSFISAAKVLPSLKGLIKAGGGLVCLVKPQFETGGRLSSKRGVVRDEKTREAALSSFLAALESNGFSLAGTTESPITGRDGNVEYLTYAINRQEGFP